MNVRTNEELDQLKQEWLADPIWDLFEAEGFEAHKDELLAFQREQEARWDQARKKRLIDKAEKIGAPGNIALAEYIERLESRIETLENKMNQ